jgi:voltage-gated potassium channel
MTETRCTRWEKQVDWPLIVAAILFLIAYAWPILDPGIGHGWRLICHLVAWLTWALFVLDYLVRLALTDDRPASSGRICPTSLSLHYPFSVRYGCCVSSHF